ncbi:MAG: ABC-three component system middle component 1 [Daejeonella sp.]
MASSLNNEALASIFEVDFPTVEVTYQEESFGGKIHAFFLKFSEEGNLESNWRKISNAIAVYFQSKLKDEFGKWNTYIFYLSDSPVNRVLKYKIENDTFSSRKILVEKQMSISDIIMEHIVNDNLKLANHQIVGDESETFLPDSVIWNALNGNKIRGKRSVNSTADEVLNTICSALKEEQDEI